MKELIKALDLKSSVEFTELLKMLGIMEFEDTDSLVEIIAKSDIETASAIMDFMVRKFFDRWILACAHYESKRSIYDFGDPEKVASNKSKGHKDKILSVGEILRAMDDKARHMIVMTFICRAMTPEIVINICRLEFTDTKKITKKFSDYYANKLLKEFLRYFYRTAPYNIVKPESDLCTRLISEFVSGLTTETYKSAIAFDDEYWDEF